MANLPTIFPKLTPPFLQVTTSRHISSFGHFDLFAMIPLCTCETLRVHGHSFEYVDYVDYVDYVTAHEVKRVLQ